MTDSDLEYKQIRAAYLQSESVLCVHYACENFYQVNDRPAAISCISIAAATGDGTKVFSLNKFPVSVDAQAREIGLLRAFYRELGDNPDARLVHWNMNAAHYGFGALESRYHFLTGEEPPYTPPRDRLHDLDSLIAKRFGDGFAKHPKLKYLADLNDYPTRYYLAGPVEAERFARNDYGAIDRSTSEKARIIAQLLGRLLDGTLRTMHSVGSAEFADEHLDAVKILLQLGTRFRNVERSLKRRHQGRATLLLNDEYDAQDLLRALLQLFFDDIRDESVTPEYAGGSSRIDFVLPAYSLAVELKYARGSMNAKKLGDELILDRDRYKALTNISHLVCLVFDHEGLIENPRGIEKDLMAQASEQGIAVTVRIYDR